MERIYALGVSVIEIFQDWLQSYDGYFETVNDVSNPNHMLEYLFPCLSIVDSVFAAQLVLCMAFGNWLNAVMKWWLLEDRPYWWVRETDFYAGTRRPVIRQTKHSCETGPGCPSGHSETAAMTLILVIYWIVHVMNDRRCYVWWWKYIVYPLCGVALGSVMMARMYVGTHFPHQVLAGALLGAYLAPALCIYVVDPLVWQYGGHPMTPCMGMLWRVASALATIAISVVTYFSLVWCGFDPQWTIKLAFRWCEAPDHIHVSTTPMYSLAHSTGHLLGWALSVSPAVAKYRHYTKSRSLLVAAFATAIVAYSVRSLQDNLNRDNAIRFYLYHFIICVFRVPLLLRLVPFLASWPYRARDKRD